MRRALPPVMVISNECNALSTNRSVSQNLRHGYPFLSGNRQEVLPSSLLSALLLCDQPRTPCHACQHLTVFHLGSLRQSLVGPIGVQADGVVFSVTATYATEPIVRVPDQRAPFESKTPGPPIRIAFPACGRLQTVELTTMQTPRYDIPQAGTCRLLCFTHRGC